MKTFDSESNPQQAPVLQVGQPKYHFSPLLPIALLAIVAVGSGILVSWLPTWVSNAGSYLTHNGTDYVSAQTTGDGRVRLTGSLTLHVSLTGNDVTGDGSASRPWRTRGHAYAALLEAYDLNCQTVTIQLANGVYTDSFQAYGGPLSGQCGPNGLVFNGNAANSNAVLVQPVGGQGYAFSAAFGAQYKIQNMALDMSNNKNFGASGADTVSIGQGGKIIIGQNVTFGCNFNGFNAVTVAFGAFVQFDDDFAIDVGRCQAVTTGSFAAGSSSMNLASTNGIVIGMGLVGVSAAPNDMYVSGISGNTATFNCIFTQPCRFSSSGSNVTSTFTGGGQSFLDMGNGAQGYFNTNGQPDYSVIVTLGNYPFYISGFFFINELSAINAQAVTFINPEQARGQCVVVKTLSNVDTGLQGVPYLPCRSQSGIIVTGVSLSEGSRSFNVSSTAGISVGNVVNGYANPTGTFTAGSSNIQVSSTNGICVGAHIIGSGILSGAVVNGISGSTITLNSCGDGLKCVNDFPTYKSRTNVPLYVTGCGVSPSAIVTEISGNTVTISEPITSNRASQNLFFQGQVLRNSVYD